MKLSNVLSCIGLGLVLGAGAFWWLFCRSEPIERVRTIVERDREAERRWQARLDSIAAESARRDTIIAADSIQELKAKTQIQQHTNTIANLRHELTSLGNVRDSVRALVTLDSLNELRHASDTAALAAADRQRDSLTVDRNLWKVTADSLKRENSRLVADIDTLGQIRDRKCSIVVARIPCPVIVVGPGGSVTTHASKLAFETRAIQVTVGIPIRWPFQKRGR